MTLSPIALKSFFSELETASFQFEKIVPTINGKFVYAAETPIGKAYNHVFKWLQVFSIKNIKTYLTQQAFEHANFSSQKILKNYEEIYSIYEKNLVAIFTLKKENFDKHLFLKARWELSYFSAHILPIYLKMNKSDELKKVFQKAIHPQFPPDSYIEAFLKKIFEILRRILNFIGVSNKPKTEKEIAEASEYSFNINTYLEKSKKFFPLIELETSMGVEIPLEPLLKVFLKREWSKEEDEVLQLWVDELYKWNDPFAAGYLFKALRCLYTMLAPVGNILTAEELIFKILLQEEKKSNHLYTTPDRDQLDWKNKNIQVGNIIKIDGKSYQVDSLLGVCRGNQFYSLKEHHEVLRIPVSRSLLGLEEFLYKEEHNKNLEIRKIDSEGKFALVEPFISLKNYTWKSRLEETDFFNALLNQTKSYIASNRIPAGLSIDYFCYTQDKKIKSFQSIQEITFDLSLLIVYLKDVLGSECSPFKNLMKKSGLLVSKYAKFFEHIFQSVVENKKIDLEELCRDFGLDIKVYSHLGDVFRIKLLDILKKFKSKINSIDLDIEDKTILNSLHEIYLEHCLIFDFPNEIEGLLLKKWT